MGYMISSLGGLPVEDNMEYYIFIISTGWIGGDEEIIQHNFEQLARKIGPNAVVVKGLKEESFTIEVVEKYFGRFDESIYGVLPALLITDSHPDKLSDQSMRLLVPLSKVKEKSGSFDQFFNMLTNFVIEGDARFLELFEERLEQDENKYEIITLNPNFYGIGININNAIRRFRKNTINRKG